MYLDSESRRAITPQLALRVAVIGGVALVAFGLVFFRLWYLQVLSGDKYRAEAKANNVRSIKVQAPRGQIVDRNGRVLVDNRTGLAVKVTPGQAAPRTAPSAGGLPAARQGARHAPASGRQARGDQLKALPFSAATVKQDVKLPIVSYLLENQERFPGVAGGAGLPAPYPQRQIAAQLVGYVGEVNKEQLKDKRYRGVALGDRVGQAGIEAQYDRFLRGAQRRQPRAGGRAGQPRARRSRSSAHSRGASCACRSTSTCRGWASRRSAGRVGALRGHEHAQRRGARARQRALVRPQRLLEADQAVRPTTR